MVVSQVLLQALTGLQIGAIYVLVALGLTIIFGTLGVVNFAHGALFMIGGYVGWMIATQWGYLAAFLITPILLLGVGIALERGLMRHFYKRTHTDQILVTFGVALVVQELMRAIFGGSALPFSPPAWARLPMDLGFMYYPTWRLVIIGITIAVVILLYLLLEHTKFGLVVRAGMRDPEMVALLGVNVSRQFMVVFGLGALIAGVAGVVGGPTTALAPEVGMAMLVPSFVVVVVGGMGSIGGAVLAGFLLGEAISLSVLVYPPISQVIMYLVAVVVLLWRPRGLLGIEGVLEK